MIPSNFCLTKIYSVLVWLEYIFSFYYIQCLKPSKKYCHTDRFSYKVKWKYKAVAAGGMRITAFVLHTYLT